MHIILLHAIRGLLFSEHIFLHSSCTGKLPFKNWGLFDRASCSWNNVKCQLDAVRWFYWCILSSTCFGYIRPSSGALDVKLQHLIFCTEFLDGWWSWEPLRRSCVRCRASQLSVLLSSISSLLPSSNLQISPLLLLLLPERKKAKPGYLPQAMLFRNSGIIGYKCTSTSPLED